MGKSKVKKPVEYKDTFTFRLFPDLEYTRIQRRRLRLFQGRVEHFRAAINYANSFDSTNKINLLFMLGYDPRMKAYLEKNAKDVVILCADVPRELLKIYDDYWELMEEYLHRGYVDKEGNLTELYTSERENREKYRGTGALPDKYYQIYDPEDTLVDAYLKQAVPKITSCFKKYVLIESTGPERKVTFDKLDSIILKRYPYGREACGVGLGAYAGLKKMDAALEAGLARSDASKILDLPTGTDSYETCKKGIRRCQMNLSVPLRQSGIVDLETVFERMNSPPYGWDNDPHALYCFGYAVSEFLENAWVWDEVSLFPAKESIGPALQTVARGRGVRRHSYHLVTEPACNLSSRIFYLFDICGDSFHPKDELDERILALHLAGLSERKIAEEIGTISNIAIHKRIAKMKTRADEDLPFADAATKVCCKIEEQTTWPVSLVDEHLRDALCGTWCDDRHISIPVFGKRSEGKELGYFTPEKCKTLREELKNINTLVPDMIRQKYGADVDAQEVMRCCTSRSSGWLWRREAFWDCVDRYFKTQGGTVIVSN